MLIEPAILFGIVISIVIIVLVVFAWLTQQKHKDFVANWENRDEFVELFQKTCDGLELFKPFVRVYPDPPPFTQFDHDAYNTFFHLVSSLNQVEMTWDTIIPPNVFEKSMTNDNFMIHRFEISRDISRNNDRLKYCLDEMNTWQVLIDEIQLLMSRAEYIGNQVEEKSHNLSTQIVSLKEWLISLKELGIQDLDSQNEGIRWLSQMSIEVKINLDERPSLDSDPITISKYRLIICEAFESLGQIENTCQDIRVELHHIERAYKWCGKLLEIFQDYYSQIQERLSIAASKNIDVSYLQKDEESLHLNLQEAKTRYIEATPKAIEILSGDLILRGKEDSQLIQIEQEIKNLWDKITFLEKTYLQTQDILLKLSQAIERESHGVAVIENGIHELDQSRKFLEIAINCYQVSLSLFNTGKLSEFHKVPQSTEDGQYHLAECKRARAEFSNHLSAFPQLIYSLESVIKSLPIRMESVVVGLNNYKYKFLNEWQPEALTREVSNIEENYLSACELSINGVLQTDLFRAVKNIESAENKFSKLEVILIDLEQRLTEFHNLNQEITIRDKKIYNYWEKLRNCQIRQPLEIWLQKYNEILPHLEKWQHSWPAEIQQGEKFVELLKEASSLEEQSLSLVNLFNQHRRDLGNKNRQLIAELDKSWTWLENRHSAPPTPSIIYYRDLSYGELQNSIIQLKRDSEEALLNQYPKNMQSNINQLETTISNVNYIKSSIEHQDAYYEQIKNDVEKAYNQAIDVYKRVKGFRERKTGELENWPIQNSSSMITELFDDLAHYGQRYNESFKHIKQFTVEQHLHKLEEYHSEFRGIRKCLLQELEILYKNNNELKAKIDLLEQRLDTLRINYQKSPNEIHKERLTNQIQGIQYMYDMAQQSSEFFYCNTILKYTVELANYDIPPNPETVNHYLTIAERHVTTRIYNEEQNLGTQIGGDINN